MRCGSQEDQLRSKQERSAPIDQLHGLVWCDGGAILDIVQPVRGTAQNVPGRGHRHSLFIIATACLTAQENQPQDRFLTPGSREGPPKWRGWQFDVGRMPRGLDCRANTVGKR